SDTLQSCAIRPAMGARDQARRLPDYRAQIGDLVRLQTRGGYNWADRYPWIVEAARALKVRSAVIDGEAVVCGPDGVSDFERLHSRAYDHAAFLYAFELLELNGEDLRPLPLAPRNAKLCN